jgi:hypothetical protein
LLEMITNRKKAMDEIIGERETGDEEDAEENH